MDERFHNTSNHPWSVSNAPYKKVKKLLDKNSILQDNNDGLLICEALFLAN